MTSTAEPVQSVLCYVRPWTLNYFSRLLGEALPGSSKVYICDAVGVGDVDWGERFLKEMNSQSAVVWPAFLDASTAQDMQFRCRLLRTLPVATARRMLAAMVTVVDQILDELSPDLVVSSTVDCYVIDVLRFCSEKRRIPFFGLVQSMVNGYARVTARGELNPFRIPSVSECEQILSDLQRPEYRPTYLPEKVGTINWVAKRWFRETVKTAYLPLRRLASKDPFNLHCLASAAQARQHANPTTLFAPRFLDRNWSNKRPPETNEGRYSLYLPLQFTPECSVDYWANNRDLLHYEEGILRLLDEVNGNAQVFLKEHPAMFGWRNAQFYKSVLERPGAVLVPPSVKSLDMMEMTDATIVWTGSAGIEAVLLRDKPVVDLGGAFYATGRRTTTIQAVSELRRMPEIVKALLEEEPLSLDEKLAYIGRIQSGTIPGSLALTRQDFALGNRVAEDAVAGVAASLRSHIGSWIEWNRARETLSLL